MVERCLFWIGN